jgi:hypothetical protein
VERAVTLKREPALSVADRLAVIKSTRANALNKTEKGRTMCLWPETGPEGKWWYARWSDEDAAKKVIGRTYQDAIQNCVANVETAIVWDENLIQQRDEQVLQPEESKAAVASIADKGESELSQIALAANAILAPAASSKTSSEVVNASAPNENRVPTSFSWLERAWDWARKQLESQKAKKRLRVCESVSLGEKRFVAVVEINGQEFLVGGASSSMATLAHLGPSQDFAEVLKRRWSQDPARA